jgi:hypothetical protein|tara:strand:+ start:642 stop:770 length:129 start_codon:yes stop_codon:yes gene_type:complete
MKVKDKYTTKDEVDKLKISKDNYALCEMLEQLINKLEHARIS